MTLEAGIAVNSKTFEEHFLSRSSEAIKKMRQSEEYKRILESLTSAHGIYNGPAGGVLPLQLVPLKCMTEGWMGVITLKFKPRWSVAMRNSPVATLRVTWRRDACFETATLLTPRAY